ncbi:MAG TPA: hypothetical protein VFS07_05495 [Gemmatimonadales bacterium]|nr:hypothetical protein [Gemmatimonadales bacterium]
MIHEQVTTLPPADVLARAERFFADRVPATAAYFEKRGPTWVVLRGQGGEEITIAAVSADGLTKVRASTLMFDQGVKRFLSTLPVAAEAAV